MKNVIILLVCSLLLWGCKGDTGPAGPSGIPSRGSLKGSVLLKDWSNPEGVLIRLERTPYETLSDSQGRWILNDIPTGFYDVKFSKDGFYSEKIFNLQFIGGGTVSLGERYLTQRSLNRVSEIHYECDSAFIGVTGKVSEPVSGERIGIFISANPVMLENEVSFDLKTGFVIYQDTLFGGSIKFYQSDYIPLGISRGDTLYAVAVVIPDFYYSQYNPLTDKYVLESDEYYFSKIDTLIAPKPVF